MMYEDYTYLDDSDGIVSIDLTIALTNLLVLVGMLLENPQNEDLYVMIVKEYDKTGLSHIASIMNASDKYGKGTDGIKSLKKVSARIKVALVDDHAERSYIWRKECKA